MAKFKYLYKGETEVNIPYVGTFEPGKEYEVSEEINHPDFVKVEKEVKKEKKDK